MLTAAKILLGLMLNPDTETELRDKPRTCHRFSFKAVFYRTPYSYCCCPCAYQHEYFDYLSDKDETDLHDEREIDKTVFERIVWNLDNGRCPHVDKVEPKYVTTSTVSIQHVLAVAGSMEQFLRWSNKDPLTASSIFKLRPFVCLVLRNSCCIFDLIEHSDYWSILDVWKAKFMYPITPKDNLEIINWKILSLLECCARKRNSKVLQHVLMSLRKHTWNCEDLYIVYDLALKYEQREIIDSLIQNGFKTHTDRKHLHRGTCENRTPERLIGAEATIVYNDPRVLDCVLQNLEGKTSQKEKDKLVFICLALQREECRSVLLKYGFQEHKNLTELEQQGELFHILLNYPCHREEIISIIQQYKKIFLPLIGVPFKGTFCNEYQIKLDCLLNQHCYRRINSVDIIQLVTLGEDIDLTRLPIEYQDRGLDGVFRELVEFCLYSNLSNLDNLAEQTVSVYLKHYHITDLDRKGRYYIDNDLDLICKVSHSTGTIGREYTMDVNEHCLFNGKKFALNFILPLFIECGFPLKRNLIDSILQDVNMIEKLHPAETEYLIKSIEQPRSLQLCCRDSLRRHFKKRQIHRYVSISNVPNKIKDFVLLKTVLPTLKYLDLMLD